MIPLAEGLFSLKEELEVAFSVGLSAGGFFVSAKDSLDSRKKMTKKAEILYLDKLILSFFKTNFKTKGGGG